MATDNSSANLTIQRLASSSDVSKAIANLTIQRLASSSDVSKAIAKTDDTELSTGVSESNNSASASYNNSSSTNTVLLSTAIVYVVDSNGVKHQCRALLDSASQSNFITEALLNKLQLPTSDLKITITGINQKTTNVVCQTKANILSKYVHNYRLTLPFLVLSSICGQIPSSSFTVNFKVPDNIKLADPEFNKSNNIDMLLGASIFYDLLIPKQYQIDELLTGVDTVTEAQLSSCHYVDELLTGVDTVTEAQLSSCQEALSYASGHQMIRKFPRSFRPITVTMILRTRRKSRC
ncbi:putative peptidase (DUF1758) [Popillia japonica]|uniref:Peptidase (DUF1758) n=1 Tax=Popillia japonica TaxID=7064 RepID=A0AAW1K0Z6_POPJA